MNRLKAYLSVIKGEFLVSIAYIYYSYASILASFVQIIIFYFLWKAVYVGKDFLNGYTYSQIITYVVLSRVLITMFNWGVNQYISEIIKSGIIATKLLYPTNFMMNMYCSGIGNNLLSNLIFIGVPITILCKFILNLYFPPISINYLFFALSIFLGFTVMFLVDFFLGIINFGLKVDGLFKL